MAFDISIGDEPHTSPPGADTFRAFYDTNAERLASTLGVICDSEADAAAALEVALRRSSQKWKQLQVHPNQLGWALQQGVHEAERLSSGRSSPALNQATGGYLRGLDLGVAFASMPFNQRAALVASHLLGWNDDFASSGFGVDPATMRTRRTRGLAYLGHHLRAPDTDVDAELREFLAEMSEGVGVRVPDLLQIQRSGRQRTWLTRGAAALVLIGLIAGGGAMISLRDRSDQPRVAAPVVMAPPTNSSDWLGPIADQRGGFTALNTSGAARLATSADGADWFLVSVWNSRAIDLRTEISGFARSGGRYVATIEAAPAISASVTPRIATSTNLKTWRVREVDFEAPAQSELQTQIEVLDVALAGDKVLVPLAVSETPDLRAVDVGASEVCVEGRDARAVILYLCAGGSVTVQRPQPASEPSTTRFLVADGANAFVEVFPPLGTDGRRLVGMGAEFAAVNALSGDVWVSADGAEWDVAFTPTQPSRFVLLESAERGTAVVVEPRATGWRSTVLRGGVPSADGSIPLTLDPASVWTRPDLAFGPAGWALFVTTSRPWERTDITRGWAVNTGEWIVSRQPGSEIVTAQSADGSRSLRYQPQSDVLRSTNGSVVLIDPETSNVLVEISRAQIDTSLVATLSPNVDTRAQIFFSEDGTSWRSIWQSAGDAWVGTVSVGDNEVLLSGTQLTGPPLVIPIAG